MKCRVTVLCSVFLVGFTTAFCADSKWRTSVEVIEISLSLETDNPAEAGATDHTGSGSRPRDSTNMDEELPRTLQQQARADQPYACVYLGCTNMRLGQSEVPG